MKERFTYKHTIYACFVAYVVQSVVNNFAPLLFLTFQKNYGIPLSQITLLITLNFGVQLLADFASAVFVDRIGYRISCLIAHGLAALGLILLAILPNCMENAFAGLLISVAVYAMGGGLLEVLISPIVEACPTDHKEKVMSLLHSFFCWGSVGTILFSTLFLLVFGVDRWPVLTVLLALIPIGNFIAFCLVPLYPLVTDEEEKIPFTRLARNKMFWVLLLMMACAGAAEQGISQWASSYAEAGLGVSKTVGDLAGPMFFSACMGLSRAIYGKKGDRIPLWKFMTASALLCVGSYLLIALSPTAFLGLLGCGLCGFSVGIFWPGTFSMAAKLMKNGGTALFAILALAGDLGCSGGPTLIGWVSDAFGNNLSRGLLLGTVFPVLMIVCLYICRKREDEKR